MRSFINNIAIVASLIACGFSNSQESSPVEQKRSSLSPDKKWQYNCGEYAPGYCYPEIVKAGTTERAIAQCFGSAEPHKESGRRYEIYCQFKETPNDMENAPIRFMFELTKGDLRFVGVDNINELRRSTRNSKIFYTSILAFAVPTVLMVPIP